MLLAVINREGNKIRFISISVCLFKENKPESDESDDQNPKC